MGFFNKGMKMGADGFPLPETTKMGRKLVGVNGNIAGGVMITPGIVFGSEIGEISDDINDIYYKNKKDPYNSSYNMVGGILGGFAGFGLGKHYGGKATKMLLNKQVELKDGAFKNFVLDFRD